MPAVAGLERLSYVGSIKLFCWSGLISLTAWNSWGRRKLVGKKQVDDKKVDVKKSAVVRIRYTR